MYGILEEIENGKRPIPDTYGINNKVFCGIIQDLIDLKFIADANVTANGMLPLIKDARVTPRGREYLEKYRTSSVE